MRQQALDWRGLALTRGGIAAALIALESIRVAGTNWLHVAVGGGVAAALLVTAVWHLLRYRYPLIELRVLRARRSGAQSSPGLPSIAFSDSELPLTAICATPISAWFSPTRHPPRSTM